MTQPLLGQLELPFLSTPPAAGEVPRRIHLASSIVTYKLTRSRRRTLGMTIDQRGLRVGAPRHSSLQEIEGFLRANADWILRKLDEWKGSGDSGPFVACDGANVPVLGEPWALRLLRGSQRIRWMAEARELHLELRHDSDPRPLLRRALQTHALKHFERRMQHFGAHLGRPLPPLALSSAQTRWGSCSQRSGIRLNWRLIHLPPAQIDYVVAHELAHLIEMNHSARFWSQVGRLMPEFESARDLLKTLAGSIPRI